MEIAPGRVKESPSMQEARLQRDYRDSDRRERQNLL